MYVCMYMYKYMYVYTYIYMYICIHIYIYIYVYTYIYIYILVYKEIPQEARFTIIFLKTCHTHTHATTTQQKSIDKKPCKQP